MKLTGLKFRVAVLMEMPLERSMPEMREKPVGEVAVY
jgi:hypothetical protein